MDFKYVLRKIFFFLLSISLFFGLVYYCSYKIDQKRAEEKERKEKLEEGRCEFNKLDLQNITISYYKKSFKLFVNADSLKFQFNEQIRFDAKYDTIDYFRIDNTDFELIINKNIRAIKAIDLDKSSVFGFSISGEKFFEPGFDLGDFKKRYPKSYACRDNNAISWRTEKSAIRIDNTNFNNSCQYAVFYFNKAESLYRIEFVYDFEIN
ncbi:MAG TPA: hypothetical protein VNZ49_05635 [Bacteroidia bacterium]|jgi:hypothetical protein|nr:hypothetical protein [Bacteroidia bacterium]